MRETASRLWQRWSSDFWRLFRFGITGTLSSLIHYGIYCLMFLHFNYNISYTAGYLVGLLFNYVMTTFFTFRQHPSKKNMAGFAGSHVLNYLLEIVLLNLFVWLSVSEWLAPVLVMIVAVPINFLILRFVFVNRK
jgi:putative flippase GtrA